jgi:ribosomal protection tetracycline resistance protein
VDEGTAHTDNMEVERERGISVRAASASVIWKDTKINIIDTPGHVDFSAEVERSITALDGAVLVVSAAEGVQSQTEIIFHALKEMKIPVVIFINKIDRMGADIKNVTEQINIMTLKRSLPVEAVAENEDKTFAITGFKDISAIELREDICEFLAEYEETVLNRIVYGEKISSDEIQRYIVKYAKKGDIYPVFHGTALKGIGIEGVLDGIIDYLPEPCITGQDDAAGIAYKIYNEK